jgi:hypothetical protein
MEKWLKNKYYNSILLYRATRDGFGLKVFDKKTGINTPLLCVIKSEHDFIFGGFTKYPFSLNR